MKTEYTVVVKQQGDWWVGWIEGNTWRELPGKTYDELMESLKVTLQEALAFN